MPEGAGTQLKSQIPWLRVFVEGVVMVGSILLAFGIQAWWDGRQDELQLRRGLAGVDSNITNRKCFGWLLVPQGWALWISIRNPR
jgi:hypothetical protein